MHTCFVTGDTLNIRNLLGAGARRESWVSIGHPKRVQLAFPSTFSDLRHFLGLTSLVAHTKFRLFLAHPLSRFHVLRRNVEGWFERN